MPAAEIGRNHLTEQLRKSRPALHQALGVEEAGRPQRQDADQHHHRELSRLLERGKSLRGENLAVAVGASVHPRNFDKSRSRIFAVSRNTS